MWNLEVSDPQLFDIVNKEEERQTKNLELIASENFVSPAVRALQGSVLTHKYAEGYPGKRYYGGCEYVDMAETLAISRAKELFKCEYANVQPHSGSQANMAAYFSFLETGSTILGMNLSHGGHLTHGSPVNFSGKLFNFVSYCVDKDRGVIDYDQVQKLAREYHPAMIVAGASAYPRIIDFERFRKIADEVGALLMVDMAHIAGLVATGYHPSPIPIADIVTTTTHKTLRGPRGGMLLASVPHAKKLNSQVFPGLQGGPLMHVIAAKAAAMGEALDPAFKEYSARVIENAKVLADELIKADFKLVSGGTDNHLMLIDLTNKNISGKDAEITLDAAGITVNKNTIPFETRSPFITSGIRLGTPALTTRGMGAEEMKQVASFIIEALDHKSDEEGLKKIRNNVQDFASAFPLFSWKSLSKKMEKSN